MINTGMIPDANELMVTQRDDDGWSIVEAAEPGDFAKQTKAKRKRGKTLTKKGTKKEARDAARQQARDNSHPFVLLCSTKGRISDVTWNPAYDTLELSWDGGDSTWRLDWNTVLLGYDDSRTNGLTEQAKKLQEMHGFRKLKIYRKDGSHYWTRVHPRWRYLK